MDKIGDFTSVSKWVILPKKWSKFWVGFKSTKESVAFFSRNRDEASEVWRFVSLLSNQSINQSIIYFNTLRQRAEETRSKYISARKIPT